MKVKWKDAILKLVYVWVSVSAFYADDGILFSNLRFENDVKMYGTQTEEDKEADNLMFENDVKMYGTQTNKEVVKMITRFENDVKMYGTQTYPCM